MRSDSLKRVLRTVIPRTVRNSFRSPSRSAEWLWDGARFSMGITKVLTIAPDWSIVCHPRAYKVAYRDQIADAEQAEEFRAFQSHCRPDMLLFDIGSHFGVFSLAAAHFGGNAVAIDASAMAVRMVGLQAALNACSDRIQTICAAVNSEGGVMSLLSSGIFSDGYFKVAGSRPRSELTQIPAITINELVQKFGPPTHIKIDIEGHEASALRGGRETLDRLSPLLFLELHNEMVLADGGNPEAALDELDLLHYSTFTLNGHPISRAAILERPIIRIVSRRFGSAE